MLRLLFSLAVAALTLAAGTSPASVEITHQEYANRRAALRKELKGVLVIFGTPSATEEQLRSGFIQDSYFYYLTGWMEPDAVLLMTATDEELLLPQKNDAYERYYGHRTSPGDADAAEATGFKTLAPQSEFERELFRLLAASNAVYIIPKQPQSAALRALLSFRPAVTINDFTGKLDAARMVKSPAELSRIQHSANVSVEGQRVGFRSIKASRYEFQVAARMEETWRDAGCERPAYTSIVASGMNAVTLHYSADKSEIKPGELVVIDAAAECNAYAADITRTLPVDGHFTRRQAELYSIVLGAQQAAIDAIKPGAVIGKKDTDGSLMKLAYDYINTHGKDKNGEALGKYVLHGLSHHIGLDVHDPGDIMAPLKPGMVISVEPGIYIRDEATGIRIEDMVLVTETGHRVLTEALPKDIPSIEKAMHDKSTQRASTR